jgi:YHS domain-containing protein
MKSIVRTFVLGGLLAAVGVADGQDQIPWAADFRQACELAAQQKRLVLLHFYSDDCPPCVRVEENVFSRPEVAQAIARNYVPVKVHAGQNPDLVSRYQVTRWPTDVAVTPAGLEIHRSTSPQLPEHYVELVDLMALKAGVGTGRQWTEDMRQVGQATLDQAGASAQGLANQGKQQWNQLGQQFQTSVDQARAGAQQWSQQAQDSARQFGQTQTAVQQYQQQAQGAVQQYREQAQGTVQQWNQQATGAVQQFGQQAAGATQQLQNTLQQQAQAGQAAVNQWQAGMDLRAPLYSGAAAATAPPQAQTGPYNTLPQQASAAANPYLAPPQNAPLPPSTWQPPGSPLPSSGPSAPQFVAASEAPPVSLEGYCPVTLVESKKWRRADPQFGAIHRGRTYLFASAEQQKKFLADPDAYAPVLSGYDAVRFAKTGQLVEGSRAFGNSYRNRLFLFADEAARAEFEKSPDAFAQPAYQAMMRSETTFR